MQDYRHDFIEFAIRSDVLRFGQFTLKSGRQSPYFFNAGLFNTGAALARLARFYAQAIVDSGVQFDVLFGPAYKGIPLAAATAVSLAVDHDINTPWCFNRKEAKDHGEGGTIVGAPLNGRVLVIDDVITAGTAIGEAVSIIEHAGAELAAVSIALDRQERGSGDFSAIQEVENRYAAQVINIATLDDLITYMRAGSDNAEYLNALEKYRETYGVVKR